MHRISQQRIAPSLKGREIADESAARFPQPAGIAAAALERIPKSGNRFSDKMRVKSKN